jgi:hypothetical protein
LIFLWRQKSTNNFFKYGVKHEWVRSGSDRNPWQKTDYMRICMYMLLHTYYMNLNNWKNNETIPSIINHCLKTCTRLIKSNDPIFSWIRVHRATQPH